MNTILSLHSSRFASVDRLRADHASMLTQVAGIVGFALLTALGAQIKLYLWEVPITLQTLAVYGSGLFLGARNGLFAQLLYLTLGLFLPVFAGDTYGPAYLFGALSAGYLLAYPFVAFLVGKLSKQWNTLTGSMISMMGGSVLLFAVGVTWLHYAASHATWFESIRNGWLLFIPIDLAKILLVGLVYSGARRAS